MLALQCKHYHTHFFPWYSSKEAQPQGGESILGVLKLFAPSLALLGVGLYV